MDQTDTAIAIKLLQKLTERSRPAGTSETPLLAMTDDDLRQLLEDGLQVFQAGAERGDSGRGGLHYLLCGLTLYVASHVPRSQAQRLLHPLQVLIDALSDLDQGTSHPVLEPKRVPHRPQSRRDLIEFRARCLFAADLLRQRSVATGSEMTVAEGDRVIFKRAHSAAARLGMPMTEKSLQTWRRAIREELVTNGEAAAPLAGAVERLQLWLVGANVGATDDWIALLFDDFAPERLSHLPRGDN